MSVTLELSPNAVYATLGRLEAEGQASLSDFLIGSEVLLRANRVLDAIGLVERCLLRQGRSLPALGRLASLELHNSRLARALHYARAALKLDANYEPAYTIALQALERRGRARAALTVLTQQATHCAESESLRRRRGELLLQVGRTAEAIELLASLSDFKSTSAPILRREARRRFAQRDFATAILLGETALRWDNFDREHTLFMAGLYVECERIGRSVQILTESPCLPIDARLNMMLSGLLCQQSLHREAIYAAFTAIRLDSQRAEYWVHVAGLSHHLGFSEQALSFISRAAGLDPANPELAFACAQYHFGAGALEEADEMAAQALLLEPENARYRDFRLTIAERRRIDVDSSTNVIESEFFTLPPFPEQSPPPGPLGMQLRVMGALIVREIVNRNARSRFGLFATLMEPLLHMAALAMIFAVFNHGHPPLGDQWFFFYATGVVPFLLFSHVTSHSVHLLPASKSVLMVPVVNRLDIFLSTALAELIVSAMTGVIIFSTFRLFGIGPTSVNLMTIASAFVAMWAFALGISIVNGVLSPLFEWWGKLWPSAQRAAYFTSGIFYMAQLMPTWVRDILVWNPVLIAIEWFRTGFFEYYGPPWLSVSYMLSAVLIANVLGLVLERALRRKLML